MRLSAVSAQEVDNQRVLRCTDSVGALELLSDDNGRPVWPLRDGGDRQACEDVASVFGAEVRTETAYGGRAGHAVGEVVGTHEVAAEASLYAHLTGRAFRPIQAEDEALSGGVPDVIVLVGPRLSRAAVRALFEADPFEQTPGIIWAPTREELRTQVLARAAAASLTGETDAPRRIDISGIWPRKEMMGAPGILGFGTDATPEQLREAIGSGSGVLTVVGHGTGWNIRVGPSLSVCAVKSTPPSSGPNAPACIYTGECEQFHRPVEKVTEDDLLNPAEFSARVLLLLSCRAAFVGSTTVDARWGVLRRFLGNPRLGAIIATHQRAFINPRGIASELSAALALGMSVGRAVAEFERGLEGRQFGLRLMIFGDPRTRAGMPATRPALLIRVPVSGPSSSDATMARTSVAIEHVRREEHLAFFRELARTKPPDDATEEETACAIWTASDLSARLVDLESNPAPRSVRPLQLAALRHLTTLRGAVHRVMWVNAPVVDRMAEKCPQCGWPTTKYIHRFDSGGLRIWSDCPNCELRLESPATESTVSCRFDLPRVRLRGLGSHGSSLAVGLIYWAPGLGISQVQLVLGHGREDSRTLVARVRRDPSPYFARLVLLDGLALYFFGTSGKDF